VSGAKPRVGQDRRQFSGPDDSPRPGIGLAGASNFVAGHCGEIARTARFSGPAREGQEIVAVAPETATEKVVVEAERDEADALTGNG